jgi:hypothetical protein
MRAKDGFNLKKRGNSNCLGNLEVGFLCNFLTSSMSFLVEVCIVYYYRRDSKSFCVCPTTVQYGQYQVVSEPVAVGFKAPTQFPQLFFDIFSFSS